MAGNKNWSDSWKSTKIQAENCKYVRPKQMYGNPSKNRQILRRKIHICRSAVSENPASRSQCKVIQFTVSTRFVGCCLIEIVCNCRQFITLTRRENVSAFSARTDSIVHDNIICRVFRSILLNDCVRAQRTLVDSWSKWMQITWIAAVAEVGNSVRGICSVAAWVPYWFIRLVDCHFVGIRAAKRRNECLTCEPEVLNYTGNAYRWNIVWISSPPHWIETQPSKLLLQIVRLVWLSQFQIGSDGPRCIYCQWAKWHGQQIEWQPNRTDVSGHKKPRRAS